MRRRAAPGTAALLVVVLLAGGCAGSAAPLSPVPGTPAGAARATPAHPPDPSGTPGAPSEAGAPGPAAPFNGTDVAWLQLNIAMHERVLPLLDLVPRRTADPAVRRLAARIRQTHRVDLDRSVRLLDRSGAPRTNPHEGHDMPGMVTAVELATLGSAPEAEFRRLLGVHLAAHLEQSVRIAGAEQRAGADSETTALAGAIVRTGSAYLNQLGRLPD
ncbi:DUF305 domain-containing protein [Micromonospora sp. WMMD1102]|uniref:DUF305 domain-containing protein n=1 Tax=Micromonospora sp. WMMD1102 TaxID=3016105 RepID=UPI002414F7AE|nr:DUF305 domain-containing protein [Micromonospora sp. WMMD1102]MDG4791157.1 DUF305 domain-containing protein [Micromonospora sp. WMMD1102]